MNRLQSAIEMLLEGLSAGAVEAGEVDGLTLRHLESFTAETPRLVPGATVTVVLAPAGPLFVVNVDGEPVGQSSRPALVAGMINALAQEIA